MSQHELGRQLGISFQQIQKYEGGTNRISASALFRLAQIFGVSPSHFYEGIGSAPVLQELSAPTDLESSRLLVFAGTAEGQALLEAYLKVEDAGVRKRLLVMIRSMAGSTDDELSACEPSPRV